MDRDIRRASRNAGQDGHEAARLLAARVRSGALPVTRARLAALLGHGPASLAFSDPDDPVPPSPEWIRAVVDAVVSAGLDVRRAVAGPARAFLDWLSDTHATGFDGLEADLACECPWRGADHFRDGTCSVCCLPETPSDDRGVPFELLFGEFAVEHIRRLATGILRPDETRESMEQSLAAMFDRGHATEHSEQDERLHAAMEAGIPLTSAMEDIASCLAECARHADIQAVLARDLVPVALGTGDPMADEIHRDIEEASRKTRMREVADAHWEAAREEGDRSLRFRPSRRSRRPT